MSLHLKTSLTKLEYKIRFKSVFNSYMYGMIRSDLTLLRRTTKNIHITKALKKKGIPLSISSLALSIISYKSIIPTILLYGLEYSFIIIACIEFNGINFMTIILFILLTNTIEICIDDIICYINLQSTNSIKTLSEHYNAIDGDIDEKAYNSDICVQRYFQRRKTHIIKNTLNASNKDIILDIGCGSGVQLNSLNIVPKFLIGTDINQNALVYAKNKNIPNSEFIRCDAQQLPFKTMAIDKIICAELIEHLPNPAMMINEVHRILKNNGSIIITTPNEYSIWGLYEFLWDMFGRGRNYGETHLRFFSIRDLDVYFKFFTTRYTTTVFFLSPFVALLNNRTLVQWSKHFDAVFERVNFGVSIVYYAKK